MWVRKEEVLEIRSGNDDFLRDSSMASAIFAALTTYAAESAVFGYLQLSEHQEHPAKLIDDGSFLLVR